jgi:selenocysteine lyase/cysteine desulfurase
MELLAHLGVASISARLKTLSDRLIAGVQGKGYAVLSPRQDEEWSGIASFISPRHDHAALVRDLRRQHKTEIALREGRLRASPHFYNTEEQIDRLVQKLPNH